jgi:cobalt-precorrin-5B (C1)-methyltransferase
VQAVQVMAAQSETTLVLATGGRTEKAAMRMLPDLPEVCFVEVGDFTGAALTKAKELGLTSVVFVGMPGKLTKLASGIVMTHYTKSKVDLSVLADLTPEPLRAQVAAANTARHAYELWDDGGVLRQCGDALCAQVADVLRRYSGLDAQVALVDPAGSHVVAATESEWVA